MRPQTEKLKPPRAMWVPFELGRPFGAPNNPAFQTKVIRSLLKTLEMESGPVLLDFNEDAPLSSADTDEENSAWACPIELKAPPPETDSDLNGLEQAFLREISQLRPWYELSVEERGRTTVGVSPLNIDDCARYIMGFLGDKWPETPNSDMSAAVALKHSFEDIRAWYTEAVAAQPGRAIGSSEQVLHWFWLETTAGAVLQRLDPICRGSTDEVMRALGDFLLLPRSVTGSVGDGSDGRSNPEFGDNKSNIAAE